MLAGGAHFKINLSEPRRTFKAGPRGPPCYCSVRNQATIKIPFPWCGPGVQTPHPRCEPAQPLARARNAFLGASQRQTATVVKDSQLNASRSEDRPASYLRFLRLVGFDSGVDFVAALSKMSNKSLRLGTGTRIPVRSSAYCADRSSSRGKTWALFIVAQDERLQPC